MPAAALRALERCRDTYGSGGAARKLAQLALLATARLRTAEQVRRLHETLCFLRAYPDDARVLAAVEGMHDRFDLRADLRAHREALAASGIAGTMNWYPFFWPTARWLAARWPRQLRFDRVKMPVSEFYKLPSVAALVIIALILTLAMLASVIWPQNKNAAA